MEVIWQRPRPFRRALLLLPIFVFADCITAWPVSSASLDLVPYICQDTTPPQSQAPVLRSEVDLQTVEVQVKDKRGKDVPGLSAKDFTVREESKAQKIAFFDPGSGSVSVVVLVDSSSSMATTGCVGSAQAVAAEFMRVARPGDEFCAMDFTQWTGDFEKLTPSQILNPGAVTLPPAGGTGSALYDAIAAALCHLCSSTNPRQAIIVITDGVDEHSRISLDQLIGLVRSSRAQLFMIGLGSGPEFRFGGKTGAKITLVTGHDIDNPTVVFDRLMKESGAEAFIPNSERGLDAALKAVSSMLESEYTLAYYPPQSSAGKLRKIEVKVKRGGVRVLARHFVDSSRDASEFVHFEEGTCTVSPKFHPYSYESRLTEGPGGTVYRDDFSDPDSGWPEHPDSRYVPGGYELSTAEQTSGEGTPLLASGGVKLGETTSVLGTYRDNVVAAWGPSWRDFRVSATMRAVFKRPPPSNGREQFLHPVHPAAGLVFRMNETGYYALLVSPSAKDKKKLAFELVARKFQGDSYAESVLVPWTDISGEPVSLTEMELSVEDVGNGINAFVNGRQVGMARDDTYDEGYAGFIVSAPGRATFRNLVVEEK